MPITIQFTIFNLPAGIDFASWIATRNIVYIEGNAVDCTG